MRLRLATFNLENLDDGPDVVPPLAERIDALRPVLAELDADVLCLQEVNAQAARDGAGRKRRELRALDALLAETAYAGHARTVTANDAGAQLRDVQNLVVLSRFPILAQRQILHEIVPPPMVAQLTAEPPRDEPLALVWERPVLHVRLQVGGRALDVFNLHLRAPLSAAIAGQKASAFVWRSTAAWAEGFYQAALKRNGQALEARLAVDRLLDADPDARVAVCGDFNSMDREVPMATLRAEADDTGNPALAARALWPVERAVPEAARYTVRHDGRPLMLDHILVSQALRRGFVEARILNAGLGDEMAAWRAGRHDPQSLHAPVVATFEIDG